MNLEIVTDHKVLISNLQIWWYKLYDTKWPFLFNIITSLGASLFETSYGSAISSTPQSSMMIGTAGLELILVVDVKICQDRTETCPCPRSRHRSSSWPRASPPPPCRTPHGYRPGNPCHVWRHFNGFVWRHCLSHVSFTSLTGCSTWEWRREICLCSLQSWPWTRAPHRSAPADTSDNIMLKVSLLKYFPP